MAPKADLNSANWEAGQVFPSLCEGCLGPNSHLRMNSQAFGAACKICTRPFTVFRWQPGAGLRTKKTEICQTCAKIKNCCQTCLLDLQFGLPTAIRDSALGIQAAGPKSDINREYFAQNMQERLGNAESFVSSALGREEGAGKEILRKLARAEPYGVPTAEERIKAISAAKEKKSAVISSEDASTNQLETQLKKIKKSLKTPKDTSIKTLFLSSLPSSASESGIRNTFGSLNKSISSVKHVQKTGCAFVEFVNRNQAEIAAKLYEDDGLSLDGQSLKLSWGKSLSK